MNNPDVADHKLAMDLLQEGRMDEAKALLERICEREPGDAQCRFNLGMVYVELNDIERAIQCFQAAAVLEPQRPVIHYNLGRALHMSGRLPEAEASYRQAAALGPSMASAVYCNLGNVLMDQERLEEAVICFRRALRQDPLLGEAHFNLCNALKRLGRMDEARDGYAKLLLENPEFAEAHGGMGSVLFARQQFEDAVKSFTEALRLKPDLASAHFGLGLCYKELGLNFKAEASFREALQRDPHHIPSLMSLGRLLIEHGLLTEGYEAYQQALTLNPAHATAAGESVVALEKMGRFEEAWQGLQALLERPRPSIDYATTVAVAFAVLCGKVKRCDEALRMIEAVLARGESGERMEDDQRLVLHFCAGRILDRQGHYDRAFEHFKRGNDINWALGQRCPSLAFDAAEAVAAVDCNIQVFSADYLDRAPRAANRSQRPVFIVGMPRSGSSLVEQILATHPAVYGAGELDDLTWMVQLCADIMESELPYPSCLRDATTQRLDLMADQYLQRIAALAPDGALRVTDKMPGNFAYLGLIQLLFPAARIIHCVRDPMDTCLSCYFQSFIRSNSHQYSSDLRALGFYYRQYERLMAHWKSVLTIPLLDVRYEEVVADQEGATRRLLEFCELPWDDACMRFYESGRIVHTASYDQVRHPIYDRSVSRWRHYERHLEPLRRALAGEE